VSTPVTGATGATDTKASAAASKGNSLGQDAFLKLLVTQLTHQDPTKPMDNSEYITQLATFSQLEQLTKISDSVETLSTISESMSRLEDKVAALEAAIRKASGETTNANTSGTTRTNASA
jgi:flagellar basal-body rod modification protein FlgD